MPCVYWFGPAISPRLGCAHRRRLLPCSGFSRTPSQLEFSVVRAPDPRCFLRVHPPAPAAWAAALFRSRGPLPAGPALPGCSRPLPPRGCSGPDALRPPPRGLRAPRARCCEGAAGGGATRNSRCPGPARSPSRASKIACAILEPPPPGESEPGYASIVGTAAAAAVVAESGPPGGAQEPALSPLPRKHSFPCCPPETQSPSGSNFART